MAEDKHTILIRLSTLGLALGSLTGCPLPAQSLEAGADAETSDESEATNGHGETADSGETSIGDETTGDPNDPNDPGDECLLGSQRDSVGQVSEYWSPGCPVICDEGWAHVDAPLDIAWTLELEDSAQGQPLTPAGLLARVNGNPIVISSTEDGRVLSHAVDPSGQLEAETQIVIEPTLARRARMHGTTLYLMHQPMFGEMGTTLTAFEDEGALGVSGRSYSNPDRPATFDVSSLGVAVLVHRLGGVMLERLDHDLSLVWSEIALDGASTLRMGSTPSSAIVLASADEEAVVAYDENGLETWANPLLTHFLAASNIVMRGERVIVAGADFQDGRIEGRVASVEPQNDAWNYSYGRATSWCPDPGDSQDDVATAEFFNDLAILDNGSLLLAAGENYEGNGDVGQSPLVIQFAPDGGFIARDRGLWQGYAHSVLAGPDDLAFVLTTDNDTGGLILRAYHM